jgi:hypothetical protein
MNWFQSHSYVATWLSATIALVAFLLVIIRSTNVKTPTIKTKWFWVLLYPMIALEVFAACLSGLPLGARILAGVGAALLFLVFILREDDR